MRDKAPCKYSIIYVSLPLKSFCFWKALQKSPLWGDLEGLEPLHHLHAYAGVRITAVMVEILHGNHAGKVGE
jgi:hypothetical protein